MTSEDIQTNLRLPANLKAKLRRAAEANKRSTNAEVVARLEASFSASDLAAKGPTAAIDEHTLDLFAEKVGDVVGHVLDERERKRRGR
jgi:plasmid stability protein